MDNFMDKIAQRLNSQEIIRANAQAEALQMRQLQAQFEAYDECLKEMRLLNQKNTQLADAARKLVEDYNAKLEQEPEEEKEAQARLLEEVKLTIEDIRGAFEENAGKTEELLLQSQDFVHKENVKVYRNVQAVVMEELKTQTQELNVKSEKLEKQAAGMKPMVIITLILAAVNAGMLTVQLLNLFGILAF